MFTEGLVGDAREQSARTEDPNVNSRLMTVKEAGELIEGVGKLLTEQAQRIYRLEAKVGKYERIFDSIFKQEAAERLNLVDNPRDCCGQASIDPLRKLRQRFC